YFHVTGVQTCALPISILRQVRIIVLGLPARRVVRVQQRRQVDHLHELRAVPVPVFALGTIGQVGNFVPTHRFTVSRALELLTERDRKSVVWGVVWLAR